MGRSIPSRAQMARWAEDLGQRLASTPRRKASELIRDIVDLSEAIGDGNAESLLDAYPDLFGHAPFLTRRYRDYILSMESAEAQRLLLISPHGPVTFAEVAGEAARVAYDRVHDMFGRVEFQRCRRFVMVGCGQLPVTVFHVHDKTDVSELVALDIRPDAVETVGKLAARLGLLRVKAERCDALRHDFSEAQIVYVANMVSPKGAVLARIADTAPDGVQIIVREPYALGRLWAESGERDLDPRLEVTARGPGSRYLSRDVFLRRR